MIGHDTIDHLAIDLAAYIDGTASTCIGISLSETAKLLVPAIEAVFGLMRHDIEARDHA